jgi:hypothetical protein
MRMHQNDNNTKFAVEFLRHGEVAKAEFKQTLDEVRELVNSDSSLKGPDRCVQVWKMSLIDIRS